MEDTLGIFALSLAMLVGCFVAGTIPLTVPLSEVGDTKEISPCTSVRDYPFTARPYDGTGT